MLTAIGGEDAPRRRYLSSVNPVVDSRRSIPEYGFPLKLIVIRCSFDP